MRRRYTLWMTYTDWKRDSYHPKDRLSTMRFTSAPNNDLSCSGEYVSSLSGTNRLFLATVECLWPSAVWFIEFIGPSPESRHPQPRISTEDVCFLPSSLPSESPRCHTCASLATSAHTGNAHCSPLGFPVVFTALYHWLGLYRSAGLRPLRRGRSGQVHARHRWLAKRTLLDAQSELMTLDSPWPFLNVLGITQIA